MKMRKIWNCGNLYVLNGCEKCVFSLNELIGSDLKFGAAQICSLTRFALWVFPSYK